MKFFKLNNQGFTLIELMIVVAIIGITAAIAFPAFMSQLPNIRLNIAKREIAQQLQLTRLKAVSTNKKHRILFTVNVYPAPDSYIMQRLESGIWSTGPITTVKSEVTLPMDADIDHYVDGGDQSSGSFYISFNPNGSSYAESGVYLDNINGRKYKITITTAVGKVNVYDGWPA